MNSFRLFASIGLAAILVAPVQAAQKQLDITLDQSFSYESNPRMITQGAQDLKKSSTTPTLIWTSKTPTSFLDARASVTQNLTNLEGYSTTDLHGGVRMGKDTERWGVGLDTKADYDNTHTSELTTLGQNIAAVRHTSFSIAPQLSYKPTVRDSVTLTPSYTLSTYDDAAFTDYTTTSARLDYTRQLTPQHSLFVATNARRYQAHDGAEKRVDSLSPTVGWLSNLTPQFKGRVSVGAQSTQERTPGLPNGRWEWSQVYDAALTFKGEQHTASLTFSRSQQPYLNGDEELLTSLRMDEGFQMTALVALSFSGAFYWGEESAAPSASLKNRWEVNPSLSYRILPKLDLTGGYRYRSEELYNRDDLANSHVARVGVVWKP